MVIRAYCYQMKRTASLLEEDEWRDFEPFVQDMMRGIKEYRRDTSASLSKAHRETPAVRIALATYEKLTGDTVDHPDQLWVVRAASYGRLCPACSKPFRTPRAKMCSECGHQLPDGQIAGPLSHSEEQP
jgi:hypothetical protein